MKIPTKIAQQIKQYRTQVDDVQQFIDDCLVKDEKGRVAWSSIVEAYNHYKNTEIKMRSRESTLLRKQFIDKCFKCDYKSIKDTERDTTFLVGTGISLKFHN